MLSIIHLILFAVICTGVVFLQIFLSKRESKIPGLILPCITFALSLLFLLNFAVPEGGATADLWLNILISLLLSNIPTFILMAIYFACREKIRKSKQLDKMNIQDL